MASLTLIPLVFVRIAPVVAAGLLAAFSVPALAQDNAGAAPEVYLDGLKSCQLLTDDSERLACFDNAVSAIVTANDAGDVRVVDREDVQRVRRQLFGFTVPDLDILQGDGADENSGELLETVITSVRYQRDSAIRFTTSEGAVWLINNAPTRLRTINEGDTVIFRKASLGTFFIRIGGQMGVKGRRVE
jgi:hypothetical protein